MNLANKITIFRIYLTLILIVILVFPFDSTGINIPKLFVNEALVVDFKYIIAGCLFIVAALTDFLDGYIARKKNQVTNFGKMLDAIADKILVNSVLIILAAYGFIHPIIPVIIVSRDAIVNAIKSISSGKGNVIAASNMGKIKTITLMLGLTLTLFYNLPFELYNFRVSDFLLLIATILSVVSGYQYYENHKKIIKEEITIKSEDV